jgi:copper homeostasis protein
MSSDDGAPAVPAAESEYSTITLEVIATSLEDAVAAEQGGADRLELVTDLSRDGMTPSLGLLDDVLARVRIPVRVMLRETEPHEVADVAMQQTILQGGRQLAGRPVDGIVCGFLRGGEVDVAFMADVAAACGSHRLTFHRAFDAAADPLRALSDLARIPQIDRVLSSGGDGAWEERTVRLEAWARLAAPGITLIVGGGVTEALLTSIAAWPGLREVHVGRAVRRGGEVSNPVDPARVAAIRRQLDQARR